MVKTAKTKKEDEMKDKSAKKGSLQKIIKREATALKPGTKTATGKKQEQFKFSTKMAKCVTFDPINLVYMDILRH